MLDFLLNSYTKILKINYKENSFEEIKVASNEKVNYSGLDKWFITFANNSIDERDRYRFLTQINSRHIEEMLVDEEMNKFYIVYRRKTCFDKAAWHIMTIYKIDNETAYLTVQEIQGILNSIQLADEASWKILPIEKSEEVYNLKHFSTLGALAIEVDTEIAADAIPYYLFNRRIYSYGKYYILFVSGATYDKFYSEITKYYRIMDGLDGVIGHYWTDDEEMSLEEIADLAIKNLNFNKEKN